MGFGLVESRLLVSFGSALLKAWETRHSGLHSWLDLGRTEGGLVVSFDFVLV